MKNYVESGDTIELVLAADVLAGGVTVQGAIVAVATKSGKVGDTVAHKTTGVYDLPYGAAAVITAGDKLYWDGTKLTKTVGSNTYFGHATEARAANAGTARAKLIAA